MKKTDSSKKQVIWDLFGGGCNSISRCIKNNHWENDYIVYTFDVVDTHEQSFRGQLPEKEYPFQHYLNIDLSQKYISEIFQNLIDTNQIQKPDIITSSTLCQSFSKVLSMHGGGTCFWKQQVQGDKNSPLVERSVGEFERLKKGFTAKLSADKQLFIKRLGQKCVENTVELIRAFQPTFWYIENPDSSLLFQYLQVNLHLTGFLNVACFGAYGFEQNKSGGFFSNIEIPLNKQKRPPTYYTAWEEVSEEYFNNWMAHVLELKEQGSSGDRRHIKAWNEFKTSAWFLDNQTNQMVELTKEQIQSQLTDKYFRRWYVDHGYKIGDKGHSSLKKTTMTLGKLTKQKYQLKTLGDFDTRQIGEANETSHIPEGVIQTILEYFKPPED